MSRDVTAEGTFVHFYSSPPRVRVLAPASSRIRVSPGGVHSKDGNSSADAEPESGPLEDSQSRGAEAGWPAALAGSPAGLRLVAGPRARAARLALSVVPGGRAPPVGAPMGGGSAIFHARLGHLSAGRGHVSRRAGGAAAGRPRLAVRSGRATAADFHLSAGVSQPDQQQDDAGSGPAGGAVAARRVGGEPLSPAVEDAAPAHARRPTRPSGGAVRGYPRREREPGRAARAGRVADVR